MKVKKKNEQAGLKLSIHKSKITSWQIEGVKTEAVTDFIFPWAPKSLRIVTAAMKLEDTCSLEEKLSQT